MTEDVSGTGKEITLISVNDVIYEYGFRTLSSYLKTHGYKVNLIFLTMKDDQISQDILSKVSDICSQSILIGVSVLTHSLSKAIKVTDFLKESRQNTPIVWGGVHVSGLPVECLSNVDIVCVGEGEETLLELAQKVRKNEKITNIPNLYLKDHNGQVIRNSARPLIQDLDMLPFPDYSLDSEFSQTKEGLIRLDYENIKEYMPYYNFNKMGYTYIAMSSRGCPLDCTFCCNNVLRTIYKSEKFVRKRSVENIISEIEQIRSKFSYFNAILFEDDSFLFRTVEEMREFENKYRQRVNLPFGIEMSPSESSRPKLELLKSAGLALVHLGIQSGDEQIRIKYYNRKTSTKKIIETNKILTDLKILHKYDIIIDTPFSGDAESSLRLIKKFRPYFSLNLYSLKLYPGLALEKLMIKSGYGKWIGENERGRSYNEILKDDPQTFALKLYRAFPPTWSSFALARFFSSDNLQELLKYGLFRQFVLFIFFPFKLMIRIVKSLRFRSLNLLSIFNRPG